MQLESRRHAFEDTLEPSSLSQAHKRRIPRMLRGEELDERPLRHDPFHQEPLAGEKLDREA